MHLAPITEEEQLGLDAVSSVLDEVSWSYWKPGDQPAQLLDWLYLGDLREAMNFELLAEKGITAVLNLIGWWELTALLPENTDLCTAFSSHGIHYMEVDSEDRLFFDILGLSWTACEAFLAECERSGRKVLVHCYAGHNRSACMCVAWLLVRQGMTLLKAMEWVQTRRGTILSNHGFRLQLVRLALERESLGAPSSGTCTVMPRWERNRSPSWCEEASPKIDHIISQKRFTCNYDWNSADLNDINAMRTRQRQVSSTSEDVRSKTSTLLGGMVSQRNLSMGLLACLMHLGKNFREDYEFTSNPPAVIGTGFSGDVLLCQRRDVIKGKARNQKNLMRVVKKFNKNSMVSDHLEKLKNEATIYLSLEHPNIARLFDVYEDAEEVSLLMQYCPGGTLEDSIRTNGVYGEERFKDEALQMLRAMRYIHRIGIVHRDIKPRNWVYEADGKTIKLIDFGFSVKQLLFDSGSGGSLKGCLGTLGYLAPEVVKTGTSSDEAYTEKCDIWSLSVVFYDMLKGEPAFDKQRGTCDGYTEEVVLRDIQEVTLEDIQNLLDGIPEGPRDFLGRMLTKDPVDRPSAYEMLQHCYLDDVRQQLHCQPKALPLPTVLERIENYSRMSGTTRASLLAMARSPTRLPWDEFLQLRATFNLFDAYELRGNVDLKAFLKVLTPRGTEDAVAELTSLWDAVSGGEEILTYIEFIATVMPPIEDAFEDVSTTALTTPTLAAKAAAAPGTYGTYGSDGALVPLPPAMSMVECWDPSQPVASYFPFLASRPKPIQDMVFDESMPVREVVAAMSEAHYRWVVVRYKEGWPAFFDYMDICHLVVQMVSDTHANLADVLERISNMNVGDLANCSSYCEFVPTVADTPLSEVLKLLAQRSGGSHASDFHGRKGRLQVHRVPIVDSQGEVIRIFSCLDFLDLAMHFDRPAAVLKSRAARTFDRREEMMECSVPSDASVLQALEIMAQEHLTICPCTSKELSGDLGGVVATGVMAVSDLKWVLNCGEFDVLERSLTEFIQWRTKLQQSNPTEKDRQQRLWRFNVVSVDQNESIFILAQRLMASRLQRIFLSSDEIARIVGIVSSRDILIEVLEQILLVSAVAKQANPIGRLRSRSPSTQARSSPGGTPSLEAFLPPPAEQV